MNGILSGIKVLDFGSFLAGPLGCAMLAMMGAEVVKVESPKKPDGARFFNHAAGKGVKPHDYKIGSSFFDVNNVNKKGLVIDLSSKEGQEIILEMVKDIDVLIENMSPGAITRLGLSYEQVKAVNPDIVFVSSSACGQNGPEKFYIGYAPIFANKVGLGHITGYPDARPSNFVGSIDARSATMTVYAVLSALFHRARTGEGQYIDISSQEAIAAQMGDVYLDCSVNGTKPMRDSNRHESYAPNGAYKTNINDQWISISIYQDDNNKWQALCKMIGREDLFSKFPKYEDRCGNQDEIDAAIEGWTINKEKYEITKMMQEKGICAAPTLQGYDFPVEPHLLARNSFVYVPHKELGNDYMPNPPWRFSDTECAITSCAPIFGEHSDEVLKKYLNFSDEKLKELRDKGIIV